MTEINEKSSHSAEIEEEKLNETKEITEIIEKSSHSAEIEEEKENGTKDNKEAWPSDKSTKTSTEVIDILSEQFENYLLIAKALLKTLKRPKDIEICTNLLLKVQRVNDSKQTEVKRNNNYFVRYYLKILKWTSNNQPFELYRSWYPNQETPDLITESSAWLKDNKSFMALKNLKDGSVVIYGAIADDPLAGWQDGGLNILAKRGACSRNL